MTDYFEARGVKAEFYKDAKLPAYYKEVLEGLPHDARILDFGCGFGQNLFAIKNHNFTWQMGGGNRDFRLVGIDINPNAINFVKSLDIESFLIEDIFTFKPKEKFDLIITTHVLEHLPKNKLIDILKHFRESVLKENGAIFVAVPNAQSFTGCYWAYEDFTHNTLFTAGSLIYVLKMAGFKNINIIDKDALAGSKGIKKWIKKVFLKIYTFHIKFWCKMTNSAFHAPSPQVFSYEIKALAN